MARAHSSREVTGRFSKSFGTSRLVANPLTFPSLSVEPSSDLEFSFVGSCSEAVVGFSPPSSASFPYRAVEELSDLSCVGCR